MRLVPTSGVLGIVAKMDRQNPEAARTFLQLALYESMCDQADAARDEVEPYVLAKMADTLVSARKTLLRNHVGKAIDANGDSADLPYAQGMAVLETHIEKSISGILQGVAASLFSRKHPRGADGRWIHANVGAGTTASLTPAEAQTSLHNEAQDKVDNWRSNDLITDTTPITMHHREHDVSGHPIGGDAGKVVNTTTAGNLKADALRLEDNSPDKYKIEGVSVTVKDKPMGNVKSRVALDIMAAAMGDKGMGSRLMNGLPMDRKTGDNKPQDSNAERWNKISSPGDRQSYRRMSMTGSLLHDISAPGSTLDTVGGLAQLIGQIGPEAEKVLGPGVRRTAYRYRGTEKRPDRALVKGVAEANRAARSLDVDPSKVDLDGYDQAKNRNTSSAVNTARSKMTDAAGLGIRAGRGADRTAPNPDADPVALTNHYWMDQRVSADFRTMGMRGDAAVVNMLDSLPTKDLTELGVASGEIPPSQGVIINARGDVVTQAMGYNGDHYLPFDLKNLNALHGGQYVRTRANGGPTTEDIYTGLLSGARQIQVVSNSGVFTLEFDPDLRGGRRYSDKAARMIDRYGKLLETIVGNTIWQQDLSPEKMTELRSQAKASAKGSTKRYTDNLQTLMDEARLFSQVTTEDDEAELAEGATYAAESAFLRESAARAKAGAGPMSNREKGAIMGDARAEYELKNKNQGARKLKLDGPGYDRALKTLRQEFPYYIRQAKWESLPDYLRARRIGNEREFRRFAGKDLGHVERGQVHFVQHQLPTGAGTPAPAVTVTPDAAAIPAAAGSERPAAANTVRSVTEAGPVAISSLFNPRSKFVRELALTVTDAVGPLSVIALDGMLPPPPEGDTLAEKEASAFQDMGTKPMAFTQWKLRQLMSDPRVGPDNASTAFASWLLDSSTPVGYRNLVADDLKAVPALVADTPSSRIDPEATQAAVDSLLQLMDAVDPFAIQQDRPEMATPSSTNPRPQRFADIPNTVGREGYDEYLADHFNDRDFTTEVEEMMAMPLVEGKFDDEAVANQVEESLKSYEDEQSAAKASLLLADLTAKQKAWSFIKARHAAGVLGKFANGKPGDADPFVFSKAAEPKAPRRTIVFRQPDNQFSKLFRESLRR